MEGDGKKTESKSEAEGKVVNEDVKKMRKLMPEVFGQLNPDINTIPELMTAMQQRAGVDDLYYAELTKTQAKVSISKRIIHLVYCSVHNCYSVYFILIILFIVAGKIRKRRLCRRRRLPRLKKCRQYIEPNNKSTA